MVLRFLKKYQRSKAGVQHSRCQLAVACTHLRCDALDLLHGHLGGVPTDLQQLTFIGSRLTVHATKLTSAPGMTQLGLCLFKLLSYNSSIVSIELTGACELTVDADTAAESSAVWEAL